LPKLKRIDVLLTDHTQEILEDICKKVGYCCTISDLIRYALYKVYKVDFKSCHVWIDLIEKELPKILVKKKGVKNGSNLHED